MKKIVVVGGGLIGSSIAWHLCKLGYKPVVVEKDFILENGASGACEGLMLLQSKKPGIHLDMAIDSINAYEKIDKELSSDIEFEKTGGIVLIHSKREMEILQEYVNKQKKSGATLQMLSCNEVKKMVPQVAQDIQGGSFSPNDAVINPLCLTHAWHEDIKTRGGEIIQNCEVLDIELDKNVVKKVITSNAQIDADIVINATGAYGAKIAKMVNLDIPITPRKGEIMVTRAKSEPILKYPLLSATYIAAKYDPEIAKSGTGFAIDQTKHGNILIGSTREFVEFDKSSTMKGMGSIAKSITKTLPYLKNISIIRSFAGLRPYTPDGLPFLGEHKKVKGFIFACGHEGDGVTLGAITGEIISKIIDNQEIKYDMNYFDPARFDKE